MASKPHSIACEIVEGVTVPDYPELAALAADYLSVEARIINLQEQLAAETHLHVKYAAEAAAQKNRADGLNEQLEAVQAELTEWRTSIATERLQEQLEALQRECDGWRSQYQDIANQMIERGGGSVMEHARRAVEAGE